MLQSPLPILSSSSESLKPTGPEIPVTTMNTPNDDFLQNQKKRLDELIEMQKVYRKNQKIIAPVPGGPIKPVNLHKAGNFKEDIQKNSNFPNSGHSTAFQSSQNPQAVSEPVNPHKGMDFENILMQSLAELQKNSNLTNSPLQNPSTSAFQLETSSGQQKRKIGNSSSQPLFKPPLSIHQPIPLDQLNHFMQLHVLATNSDTTSLPEKDQAMYLKLRNEWLVSWHNFRPSQKAMYNRAHLAAVNEQKKAEAKEWNMELENERRKRKKTS